MIIQRIVETRFALEQRPRSFQQNGLLGNRLRNFKRPEKLGLRRVINKKAC